MVTQSASRARLRDISHLFLSDPDPSPAAPPRIVPVWMPADAGYFSLLGALAYGLRMHGMTTAIAHADSELANRDPRTRWPHGAHRFGSFEEMRAGITVAHPGVCVCLAPVPDGGHPAFGELPFGVLVVPEDGAQLTPAFQALKQIKAAGCRRVVALATATGARADRLNGDAAFARLAQHARIYIGWQPGYIGAIRLGVRPDESPNAADVFSVSANLAAELTNLAARSDDAAIPTLG